MYEIPNAVRVGVIGCGTISETYFSNAPDFAPNFEIVACADLDYSKAEVQARRHICKACASVKELLADPTIDLVLNLTIPQVHAEINLRALQAGKHVYSEKPLATTLADARALLRLASEKGLRIGCAPDTFLGGAHQEVRELVDSGAIGNIVGGCAFMLTSGPESWHPAPESFYKPGAGPLFDMGPYYLSVLVNLLGPVKRVTASAQTSSPRRTITSKPLAGQSIIVEVPTHSAAVLDFAGGQVITLLTSFDVKASTLPNMELYGTDGSIQVPDPNHFGGKIIMRKAEWRRWKKVPYRRPFTNGNRGVGLSDMTYAMHHDLPHKASGELALHIVEVMEAIHTSSEQGTHIVIQSAPDRPAPLL